MAIKVPPTALPALQNYRLGLSYLQDQEELQVAGKGWDDLSSAVRSRQRMPVRKLSQRNSGHLLQSQIEEMLTLLITS